MKRDDLIFDIIEKEHQRQMKGIELIASENFVSDQVMAVHWHILHQIIYKHDQLLIVRFGQQFDILHNNVLRGILLRICW